MNSKLFQLKPIRRHRPQTQATPKWLKVMDYSNWHEV